MEKGRRQLNGVIWFQRLDFRKPKVPRLPRTDIFCPKGTGELGACAGLMIPYLWTLAQGPPTAFGIALLRSLSEVGWSLHRRTVSNQQRRILLHKEVRSKGEVSNTILDEQIDVSS